MSGPVFSTGAPGGIPAALRMVRTERRTFDGNSPLATDPALRGYLTDLVRPYRLGLREDLLAAGAGHSYGEMAEPLIEAIVGADSPVDLLIIAYGIHDVRLGRATATYLSDRCPGEPLAFAVCDQGVAAAYTALRTIGAYAATGDCRRALLLVVEQSALQYELAGPAPVPDRNAAVAFLLEESPQPQQLTVHQHTSVTSDQAAAVISAEVVALSAGRRDVTLILDPGLAATWPDRSIVDEMVTAPAGQPYTGVWWELAGGLTEWQERDRLVLLAEHDPALGYVSVAAIGRKATSRSLP